MCICLGEKIGSRPPKMCKRETVALEIITVTAHGGEVPDSNEGVTSTEEENTALPFWFQPHHLPWKRTPLPL